jgi:hypothetical protein
LGSESEYKTPEPTATVVQEQSTAPASSQNKILDTYHLATEGH